MPRNIAFISVASKLALLGLFVVSAACARGQDETSGLEKRIRWTTSRMVGSPDPPPPYLVEEAFPKLTFSRPVVITNSPASGRLFVAEQRGKIYSFKNDAASGQLDLLVDLKKARPNLTSLYGFTFHPQCEQNRLVYVCYMDHRDKKNGTRVSQFKISDSEPPTLDPGTEKLLLTWPAGGHNGGCLKFGRDGYLYISTGDASGPAPPDVHRGGQDVSNLLSSILRIDIDHQAAGKNYRIPPDNPLIQVENARPEIWSYGFRNPWKMSFDSATGDLWVGDVGWELWEMIYRVKKGGNYGWSIMEGRQVVLPEQEPGPTPILPPTIDHPHSEAASITGGLVYHGKQLSELDGAYVYGDYQSGIVWAARMDGEKVGWHKELAQTPLQIVGFGEDNSGELYLLDLLGKIYRLAKNSAKDNSTGFPRKLSDTGLFASTRDHTPAAGVIPYTVNVEQWADSSQATRLLAVPDDGRIAIDAKGNWTFPDGSVIAKTVSVHRPPSGSGESTAERRLETQVLHREAGSWRPYSYAWNEQQTDAELVDSKGLSRTVEVSNRDAPGGRDELSYRFAGRKECTLCHNPWVEARTTIFGVQSASLLGVNVRQLNRSHEYGETTANQLTTYQHIGLLDAKPIRVGEAPKLTDPYDESADLDQRARSYLHVNCAHCHQFNAGGVATINLSKDVALDKAKLLNARPTQGAFGIANAQIIAPGDPYRSVLYYRISKLGGGRMPRLGSHEVDVRAVQLIHDWITQLDSNATEDPPASFREAQEKLASGDEKELATTIGQLTSSTRNALMLLQLISEAKLDRGTLRQIAMSTKQNAPSEIRDLFEQFLPASERTRRLGAVVNQEEVLALPADAKRGERVFFENSAAACKSCHRIAGKGETLGPDLSAIGKKYSRELLLQHILAPSRTIEPKFVPYLLETKDGRVLSGLVERQTDDELVIKDAKNKSHRFEMSEVERLVRQRKSLMPDLLLRDLTKQHVADLLAYLATLRTETDTTEQAP